MTKEKLRGISITTVPPMSDYEKSMFLKAWKATIPKFDPRFTNGAVIIYGTAGEVQHDYHNSCEYCKDTFWTKDPWAEFCPECLKGKEDE